MFISIGSLFGVQMVFQTAPDAAPPKDWYDDFLTDSSWLWALFALLGVLILVAIAGAIISWRGKSGSIASGITPTLALVVPAFTIWLLVLKYAPSPGGAFENGKILLLATVMALAVWAIAAIWRGMRSTVRDVTPEIYERMKTEYLSLRDMPATDDTGKGIPPPPEVMKAAQSALPAMAGPLPAERVDAYLDQIAGALGLIDKPANQIPSPRAWNMGTGYLEVQSRLDYARDSLIARETDKATLMAHAYTLDMRLSGSHFAAAVKLPLKQQLDDAKAAISNDTTKNKEPAHSLYTIASALSAYAYERQRSLLRLRNQQHWLIVVVQFIGAFLLAAAVLAGAEREAIAAAIVFSLVGSASGVLSLLQVRQTGASPDLGEDYGLFRVELARAFTLSGMAAVMAVFLVANLPVLATGTDIFDPPSAGTETPDTTATAEATRTPEEAPATREATEQASPEPGPSDDISGHRVALFDGPGKPHALAQDLPAAEPDEGADDDEDSADEFDWRALEDIYSFANLGGLLVALIAGWVPERLFRQLTDYGSRLRLDIQSVSKLDM